MARSAEPAAWLLAAPLDWWRLVRFGPPGYAVHLRVAFRFDAEAADEAVAVTLAVLAQHTSTPETCYAGIWEGFTAWTPPADAPRVAVPHREMLLYETDVAGLATAPAAAAGDAGSPEAPPHLAWPADRAWCFACEVDEDVEFSVGCSADAATALERVLPAQVRRTAYGAPAPLYHDEVWPLRAVADHPLNEPDRS